MIKVYHNPNFFNYYMSNAVDINELCLVTTVETNNLEEAYSQTQNEEYPWNPDCPMRSTSVGDVLELEGKMYIVDSCGWTLMEDANV